MCDRRCLYGRSEKASPVHADLEVDLNDRQQPGLLGRVPIPLGDDLLGLLSLAKEEGDLLEEAVGDAVVVHT